MRGGRCADHTPTRHGEVLLKSELAALCLCSSPDLMPTSAKPWRVKEALLKPGFAVFSHRLPSIPSSAYKPWRGEIVLLSELATLSLFPPSPLAPSKPWRGETRPCCVQNLLLSHTLLSSLTVPLLFLVSVADSMNEPECKLVSVVTFLHAPTC